MKYALPAWSSLALLAPLAGGCAAQATMTAPAVNANVDVNAQTAIPVDANATVVAAGAPQEDYTETDPSALTDFHQTLDSHGTWVEDPTYGTVWVPASAEVGPNYTPYSTAGHWAYDANDDYVWVSDYDWGWAPYHYGRWVDIEGRGWSWIPGRVYRGAWVTWGADDGYGTVGWAPMPPEYVWRGGVAVSYSYGGPARWNYVGRGDVFASNVGTHVYTGQAAAGAAGHVHPSSGVVAGHSNGPSPQNLGMSTGQVPHVTGATAGGIMKAQNFGHASTAASLGGHPPYHVSTGGTGAIGGATTPAAGHTTGMTPTNTLMPSSMHGTTTATTTTPTTTRTTDIPRANGQPGNTAVHTTAATSTTTTLPATSKIPPKKKLPTETTTPTPQHGGGTGGGTGGGHGGPPPHKK